MSVGISDRFVQRSMQGRIIVIVCETGIDAELHDTQLIGRQFVHRGEDLLHGAHIENYRINGREAICRSYARRGERLYNTARPCIITSFAKASVCQERLMMSAPIVVIGHAEGANED